jgi:phage terminase large subunit
MTGEKRGRHSVTGGGYDDFWNCRARYRIVKGSRGSKKSKTTALWLIWNIMKYPQANALVVRRYASTLRDSCYADLQWAAGRLCAADDFTFTRAPLQITYRPTGQKILFRGLDEGTKITSISVEKGVLCWVWIEELFEITSEEDFNKLDLSIRGQMPDGLFKQITATFNPWRENCWIKRRFFDAPDPDVFTLTTTWECNEWLGDDDRRIFERMKAENPRRYRIEGAGEWGISEGLIYENVKVEPFELSRVMKLPGAKAVFGLDFGFTDPTALVCAIITDRRLYVFDEWYRTGVTNKEIAAAIKDKGYGSQTIYCDEAEPKSIQELYDEGIHGARRSRKGRDSVEHGIQLIQNYEIVIHPKCTNFYKEISNYAYETDRSGRSTGRPDHEFSHGPDALRYAVAMTVTGPTFSFD